MFNIVLILLLIPLLCQALEESGGDGGKINVVIVGAGASGLAAASRLSKYSDKVNITVLEAADTIGGRIKNGEIGGQQVPLGAQWIHGEEGNAAFAIAKELDIIDFEVSCSIV